MGYVLISYSSLERELADKVRIILRNNGVECWMAPYDIGPGDNYAACINNAIENCSCFLLMLSSNAMKSAWVKREVNLAVSNNKTIVSLRLEDVELVSDFKLYINSCQIEDIRDIDERNPQMQSVISAIKKYIGNDFESEIKYTDFSNFPYDHLRNLVSEYGAIGVFIKGSPAFDKNLDDVKNFLKLSQYEYVLVIYIKRSVFGKINSAFIITNQRVIYFYPSILSVKTYQINLDEITDLICVDHVGESDVKDLILESKSLNFKIHSGYKNMTNRYYNFFNDFFCILFKFKSNKNFRK